MGIFRRAVPAGPEQHIDSFWTWWTSGAGSRFSAAAATGQWGSLPAEMQERLAAVHPDLAWDTAPGRTSRHLLAVSSEGDPVLRRIAEHWLRTAPCPDGDWEFAAARQPVPGVAGQSLEIDGHSFSLGSARFGLREDSRTGRFDVVVHHPLFAAVAESRRRQICFLLLDWLLGEDGVTRWIGAVEPTADGAAADVAAGGLLAAVTAAEASAPPGWVLLNGTTQDGGPVMVAARRPLRWIDYPTFDLHTRVHLPYTSGDNGLPTQAGLEELRGHEAAISSALGDAGVLVAHESAAGARVLHYYSDSEDPAAPAAVSAAARAAGGTLRHDPDPGWTQVRRFS